MAKPSRISAERRMAAGSLHNSATQPAHKAPRGITPKKLRVLYLWVRITVRKMEFEGLTILVKLTILSLACQREGEKL
jgi:hypothetical protein